MDTTIEGLRFRFAVKELKLTLGSRTHQCKGKGKPHKSRLEEPQQSLPASPIDIDDGPYKELLGCVRRLGQLWRVRP